MTREEIAAVIARRQETFLRRDAAALADCYGETCVVDSPLAGGPVTGRTAIAQVFEALFSAFPDSVTTFEDPLIDGNRVSQAFTSTGTDSGHFLGLPPTGKSFRVHVVFLSTVENHEIVSERRVYDFTGMLVQIGVLRAKPA